MTGPEVAARLCAVCGGPVAARPRGRPSVYCSRSCQAKAYRARKAGRPPQEPIPDGDARAARAAAADLARAALELVAVVETPGTDPHGPAGRAAVALAALTALAARGAADAPPDREPAPYRPLQSR